MRISRSLTVLLLLGQAAQEDYVKAIEQTSTNNLRPQEHQLAQLQGAPKKINLQDVVKKSLAQVKKGDQPKAKPAETTAAQSKAANLKPRAAAAQKKSDPAKKPSTAPASNSALNSMMSQVLGKYKKPEEKPQAALAKQDPKSATEKQSSVQPSPALKKSEAPAQKSASLPQAPPANPEEASAVQKNPSPKKEEPESMAESAAGADTEQQPEMSAEKKLEAQIMEQAKVIADKQLKAQTSSHLKISSAAAALNNAEMGLTTEEESEENSKSVMSISSEQIFYSGEDKESMAQQPAHTENEAAAITRAKEAAKNYVKSHPETQTYDKNSVKGGAAHPKKGGLQKTGKEISMKKLSTANLEIEQSPDLDLATLQKIEKAEDDDSKSGAAAAGLDAAAYADIVKQALADAKKAKEDDKTQAKSLAEPKKPEASSALADPKSEPKPEGSLAEEVLSGEFAVPQWKKYDNPIEQRKEIEAELASVSKQMAQFQANSKDSSQSLGETKAQALDREHQKAVSQIKAEIYKDRQGFLQQLLKLDDAAAKDEPIAKEEPAPKDAGLTMNAVDLELGKKKKNKKAKQSSKAQKTEKSTEVKEDAETAEEPAKEDKSSKKSHAQAKTDEKRVITGTNTHADNFDTLSNGARGGSKRSMEVSADENGQFVDSDVNSYQANPNGIHRKIDSEFDEDMRVHGLTTEEWSKKEAAEKQMLEELEKKSKDLQSAGKDLDSAQKQLLDQRRKIDDDITQKMKEAEQINRDYEKRKAERLEAERRAAEERVRQEREEILEEKKKKASQLKETEKFETQAMELHEKERQLKMQKQQIYDAIGDLSHEMHKIKSSVELSKQQREEAEKYRREVLFKKKEQESREAQRRKLELENMKRRRELIEERHRQEMKATCPANRVRTYQCSDDGTRLLKYYTYEYDSEENRCVEKVKKRTMTCPVRHDQDEDEDETGSTIRQHHFEDESSIRQHHYDDGSSIRQHHFAQHEADDEEEEPVHPKKKSHAHKKKVSQSLVEKPKAEDETSAEADEEEPSAPTQSTAQQADSFDDNSQSSKKKPAAHHKEAPKAPAADNKQIESLTKHLGQIEGKVSEITQKYEELKQENSDLKKSQKQLHQPKIAVSQQKAPTPAGSEEKIKKFAQMLKTLNGYKKQYKKTSDTEEKKTIHKKVADFTHKWLDAKNLQLSDQLALKSI